MNENIEINILGGKEEIGNNKILISWDNNFLCLDLGVRLSDFDIFERQKMQKMDLKRLIGEREQPRSRGLGDVYKRQT